MWLWPSPFVSGEEHLTPLLKKLEEAASGAAFELEDVFYSLDTYQKQQPTGGSASRRWRQWKAMFPEEEFLTEQLRRGIKYTWMSEALREEVRKTKKNHDFSEHQPTPMFGDKAASHDSWIAEGLRQQTTRRKQTVGGFFNLAFSALKSSFDAEGRRKRRWMLNRKPQNPFKIKIHFKMNGPKVMAVMIEINMHMTTVDCQDCFLPFNLSEEEIKFQSFHDSKGKVPHEMPVACMGDTQSPGRTAPRLQLAVKKAQSFGTQAAECMDEVIMGDASEAMAHVKHVMLIAMLVHLGLKVSMGKNEWRPSRVRDFLGWTWDSRTMRVSPMAARMVECKEMARSFLAKERGGETITLRDQASLMGTAQSLMFGMRELGFVAARAAKDHGRACRGCNSAQHYNKKIRIKSGIVHMLQYLRDCTKDQQWRHMRNPKCGPTRTCSDASEFGLGGEMVRPPHPPGRSRFHAYFAGEMARVHHNIQEMEGARATVQLYCTSEDYRGELGRTHVHEHEVDDVTTLAAMNKLRTRSIEIADLGLKLLRFLDSRHLQLIMIFQPGQYIVDHRQADAVSRRTSAWWEWAMDHKTVMNTINQAGLKQAQMVDLFCCTATARFKKRVTFKETHKKTLWTDAYSRSWSSRTNDRLATEDVLWIFPPPQQMMLVTARLAEKAHNAAIVIAPSKSAKPWMAKLRQMTCKTTEMPPTERILNPPEGRKDAKAKAPNFRLSAFYTSSGQDDGGV